MAQLHHSSRPKFTSLSWVALILGFQSQIFRAARTSSLFPISSSFSDQLATQNLRFQSSKSRVFSFAIESKIREKDVSLQKRRWIPSEKLQQGGRRSNQSSDCEIGSSTCQDRSSNGGTWGSPSGFTPLQFLYVGSHLSLSCLHLVSPEVLKLVWLYLEITKAGFPFCNLGLRKFFAI